MALRGLRRPAPSFAWGPLRVNRRIDQRPPTGSSSGSGPVSPDDGRSRIKLTSESWRLHKWLCGAPYITFITAIFIFIFHICIFCAVINQPLYG